MSDRGMQLWASGIRGDVRHYFYDIPLDRMKSFGDGFLIATVGRDTEGGRETCQFVFDRQMLIESVARMPLAVRDAMQDKTGALSKFVQFDLVATLTEPMDDVCPMFVEQITPSALTKAALMPFDEDKEDALEMDDLGDGEDEDDENEDKEEWDESYLPISVHYKPIIERLVASCDLLLKRANIAPREISLIGKLQYALLRLPQMTGGINFDVVLSHKTDDQGSWGGLSLELTEDRLSIDYVGYVRGPCGGDSDCQKVYDCEAGGYRSDDSDGPWVTKDQLDVWLADWENCCIDTYMTLKITDNTDEFDWDQPEDDDAWARMPDNDG
jgi:hypothetical protein